MNKTPLRPPEQIQNEILKLVQEFYESKHAAKLNAPFVGGKTRVPYGGRVFDQSEISNLVESALEFWLTGGRFSDELEIKIAGYLNVKYALLTNSGSSANLLALSALTSSLLGDRKINPGDEVITVAAAFPTTVAPIIQAGAVPVFCDISVADGTYNIDVTQLHQALSGKTKAVILSHTLGNPFHLDAVKEFCDRNGLWLIEDNCDAFGSEYQARRTGAFADLSTLSFYPSHQITTGEGGAVCTSNPKLKRIIESFRDWGRDCWCPTGVDNSCKKRFGWQQGNLPHGYDHKYTYSHLGYNLKMTDLQASIGCAQMTKLDGFVKSRQENWSRLFSKLSDLEEFFILPKPSQNSKPSWFGFVLTVRDGAPFSRNEITAHLESKKIQTRLLFAGNLVRHPAFTNLGPAAFRVIGELPESDRAMKNSFWIGVYPGLTSAMIDFMAQEITSFVKNAKSS